MKTLNKILIFIAFILIVSGVVLFVQKKHVEAPVQIDTTLPSYSYEGVLGNKVDLLSFTIAPYTKVHGVLSYRGTIQGGYFFEGNILINILDAQKKVLKQSNAVAKTDWMTAGPVDFEGNIDFTGLPVGSAYFEIHNDNASGEPSRDKSILIPITIEKNTEFSISQNNQINTNWKQYKNEALGLSFFTQRLMDK